MNHVNHSLRFNQRNTGAACGCCTWAMYGKQLDHDEVRTQHAVHVESELKCPTDPKVQAAAMSRSSESKRQHIAKKSAERRRQSYAESKTVEAKAVEVKSEPAAAEVEQPAPVNGGMDDVGFRIEQAVMTAYGR